jgi:superfamily II DNA/RNA helicase
VSLLADLPLEKPLLRALEKLAFTEATEVQQATIEAAMSGGDLMVSAPTGSGKTVAFLLPLLNRLLQKESPKTGTRALILLPTRELAIQTQKNVEKLTAFTYIQSGLIIGGEAFKHQVATLRKNPEILIATPGRLVDHIEKGTQDFSDLEIMVLDEADRMLDMGFAIDMNTIARACNPQRQNLLFSATLNHQQMGLISENFIDPQQIEVGSFKELHEDIRQQLILADDIKHKEKLLLALLAEDEPDKVMVFCNTRVQCQQLSNLLRYKKHKVNFIHGEIRQNERKQIMNQFRQGDLQVLIATDLAARGLDIDDIELVVNFNIAQSGDDHVHRVGRTGRAGNAGLAVTLIDSNEWNQMSSIERYLKIRFERRQLAGLKANYTGPKKVKKSGKAAGASKKKTAGKAKGKSSTVGKKRAVKKNSADSGKANQPVRGDGFGVIKKKV